MNVLGIDLGAGSGRVVLCSFDGKRLRMSEQARFLNRPVSAGEHRYWDVLRLLQDIKDGYRCHTAKAAIFHHWGIDAWGVDFGLFDKGKGLLENPHYYLDGRDCGMREEGVGSFDKRSLNEIAEGYIHPQGTLCQLIAMVESGSCIAGCAENLLMIPSIFEFFLTGVMSNEYTAATTTDIYSAFSNEWMEGIIKKAGLPAKLFKSVTRPGTVKGSLTKSVGRELGTGGLKVISVASHDTASACRGHSGRRR